MVMETHSSHHDDRREKGQDKRESPMEAPNLGVWPRIKEAHDLPTFVRIGATWFNRTVIAHICPSPVANESSFVIDCRGQEVLTLAAFPGIDVLMVGEACGAKTLRAVMRVTGEQLKTVRYS